VTITTGNGTLGDIDGSPLPAGVPRAACGWRVTTAAMAGAADPTTRRILELLREGKSDSRIAKRVGVTPEEVRARIDTVIRAARLDDVARVEVLAERVGIVRHLDDDED
jgi:DNA-binding NarL/FixJ family response regulator